MRCLKCSNDLDLTCRDEVIIIDEKTIARYVKCDKCKVLNQMIYTGGYVVEYFEDK